MKHKLESRFPRDISITSNMQMTPLMTEREEEAKSLLIRVKEETKSWLETQHSKNKIMASCSITSWQTDGEKWEQ